MAHLVAHLGRYRDIAWFLAKYARADFLKYADIDEEPASGGSQDQADALAKDLESLGPTFIKLGQLLSTRAGLLPPRYLEALSRLQDNVTPVPFAEVEQIVQDELGVRLSKAFVEFDPVPIAAASLGQVHRAVLRSGRDVAVKVQRPGIRERVQRDLEALDDIAGLVDRFTGKRNFDARRTLDEFRESLLVELDYRQEAQHLVMLGAQLAGFERIVIPQPIPDYSTSRVLTMEFVPGVKITAVSPVEWTEVDGAGLAEELFRAFLKQIVIDGTFHADPHPGNIFLTPDHRVAMLDFGMVGRLSPVRQEQLLRLVLAISHGNGEQAATIAIELGEPLENFDETGMRRATLALVGKYHDAAMKDLNVGGVMLEMTRIGNTYGLRVSPEMALLGKTLLNLDLIGRTLDSTFDPSACIRTHAPELMRERMVKSASPSNLFTAALDVKEFAERLPGRVNRILDAVAGNNLRLKVEIIDRGSIIEGFQKVANRIALGLVLAALIVGAAMLMQVPTSFTILGYPGVAMLLFLAAAGGGAWMACGILLGDVKARHH